MVYGPVKNAKKLFSGWSRNSDKHSVVLRFNCVPWCVDLATGTPFKRPTKIGGALFTLKTITAFISVYFTLNTNLHQRNKTWGQGAR